MRCEHWLLKRVMALVPEIERRQKLSSAYVKSIARECGFQLAGVAAALPLADAVGYGAWVDQGMAGAMGYLTDHRRDKRSDPATLLPDVRSILCVGLLYNTPHPYSTEISSNDRAWISRYAWGEDYHQIMKERLQKVEAHLRAVSAEPFEAKICVDTAPLLERSYARQAGLGWIGKNTCLIHEPTGSWYFLGELLLSLQLEPDAPAPDRCGTCRSCIDACPTGAIVPGEDQRFFVDARTCISYYTIEKKNEIPEEARAGNGWHVFGCDICQDVCPWNRRAPVTEDARFAPMLPPAPSLERIAAISEGEFRALFANSPVSRARYRGFLRNVIVAMGNAGSAQFGPVLQRLSTNSDEIVASHAEWALGQLRDAEARGDRGSETKSRNAKEGRGISSN